MELGPSIDWLRDFRSGVAWPRRYMRDIEYVNPDDASDVKVPWELSRLQWLMPGRAGIPARRATSATPRPCAPSLESWIDANPYAQSVNWSCTMEAALRILTWTWFFRVFHASRAWADAGFRERFLCALYLHGDFTERHLELSDVNGNHCTADAAGLVFAGLFFGHGARRPRAGSSAGWSLLCEELPRQVLPDGVDFEASVAYHRLVAELFLLPALYRRACGLDVPDGVPRAPGRDGALQRGLLAPGRDHARSGATRTTHARCRSAGRRSPTTATSPGVVGAAFERPGAARRLGRQRAARPSGCSGPRRPRRCPLRRRRRGRRARRRSRTAAST